jgi:nitrile hydratase accessory protein
LSGPEAGGSPADALHPPASGEAAPGFDEPWQAQVLAVAFSLAERGVFSRGEWSDALGDALKRAAAGGAPDTQETYYTAALAALESLLARSGQVPAEALQERAAAWRRAYLATPHGQPVELSAGERD